MTNTIIIPSNEADLDKIKAAVIEACDSMVRIEAEREHIKSIIETLSDSFPDIPVKYIRRLIKDHHKQSFDKTVAELNDYERLYESVF